MKKRVLSILLCLVLLLGLAPAAFAAEGGSFCLFVGTTSQVVIAPARISYSSGQTIQQALDASGYSFERHGYFIDVIEGVEGGYLISYDGGGYDLAEPADNITALIFSENEGVGEAHLSLLRYMIEYSEMTGNVQNYPAAQSAYTNALSALRTGDAETAQSRLAALQSAVAEYEAMLGGTKYAVSITAMQNGAALSGPAITMTDAYGNVTEAAGGTANVTAGTYAVSVSDGTWNRAERTVEINGETELSFDLPWGEWFGEINLLDQTTGSAYAKTQSDLTHTLTLQVPDTAGLTNPIVNAAQGSGIPSAENTKLYGVYEGTNGTYYGNSAKSWASNAASLPYLLSQGMGERTFALEARYTAGETTQIQSYTVEIQRIPTLLTLSVIEENTVLPLAFEPLTNSYSVTTTADSVTVNAEAFSPEYSVSGTGETAVNGDTSCTVSVSCAGRSNSYMIEILKQNAVNVSLEVPADTEAIVYNNADSVIEPVDGIYHLIPGEAYHYIATKDAYFHSRAEFTASADLTVAVAEPDTEDRLSGFALYNGSSASTRKEYALDAEFSALEHDLGCTIPDAISVIYAQATPANGYSVQAMYLRQTANPSTNGTPYTVTINKTVGASGVNPLTGCVAAGGYSQRVTVRVSKTENGITQYQDYELLFRRREHLKSLAMNAGEESVTLLDAEGTAVSFDRDRTEYYVLADRAVSELNLHAAFMNESSATSACGGYYALVNGERHETLTDVALPLDQQQSTETVTIQVCHADANAVPTTYTVTVSKTDPVMVTFSTTPSNATVFVTNNTTGKRIGGAGNSFPMIPGQTYTYTVTASGYVGRQTTDYIAPDEAATVTVVLTEAEQNTALPSYGAFWGSSRYDEYNNGAVSAKTPVTAEDAALYWAAKVGEGYSSDACGCPIIVNGYMYTYAGNMLYKIDTVSGAILATGTMDHASSFAINAPTYAEGMIFIGLADGAIQAFNAATLESVWIYHDVLNGQPDCPIAYYDGYIYTGFWNGETALANYVCLSVTDEDPTVASEEKLPSWTYTSKGGFYWAGAYVSDNYLLICTDDGEIGYTAGCARLLSLDPKTGEPIDAMTMPQPGDLRSGVTFVPASGGAGRGYFTSKGGDFYRVDVNADGTFAAGSLKSLRLTNYTNDADNPPMSTSTPTVYNGRAYVGVSGLSQFNQYSGHNITVIDLNSWSIAYTVRTQGYPQSSGLLTTSYEAETGSVNIYFFDNYTPGKLRMITDRPGQTEPSPITVESYTEAGTTTEYDTGYVLFTPYAGQAQYCICSPIVDEYGTIYFKNDSAYMMAVGSRITALEITTPPTKTAYSVGETFDAAGMTVTATYANGLTRDVTDYVEWSDAALTANDTQFQVFFPYVMYHDENGVAGTNIVSPFAVLTLSIQQEEPNYGDVNGDNKIDAKDVILLRQYIAKYDVTLDLDAADVNADGKIDAKDVILLRQYIAKYDVHLGPQN